MYREREDSETSSTPAEFLSTCSSSKRIVVGWKQFCSAAPSNVDVTDIGGNDRSQLDATSQAMSSTHRYSPFDEYCDLFSRPHSKLVWLNSVVSNPS